MTDLIPGDVPGGADPGAGPDDAGMPDDTGMIAERERLARTLRDTRLQLAMTEARLAALEQSATMGIGRAVVNAARRPWPRGALLPRDIFRLWRERSGGKEGATLAAQLAAAQLNDLAGAGERYLAALTVPGRPELQDPALTLAGQPDGAAGLVIAGALTALGCATLTPDAVVHPLLPHDADVVLESTGADLVLIEASALLAGSPWAHATDPAATDRGRRLARLIVMARSLGKPVILARDVPPALLPGLGWLAASCDVVSDDGLGVQLARFNPIGVSGGRPLGPVYAGKRDPREPPSLRAVLGELTASGDVALAGARSWRGLPELYRSHAVFLAATAEQAREQLASGARVIGPPAGMPPADVLSALVAARESGPPDIREVRASLREIFAAHATPVRLAALAGAAGLPAGMVDGRQIAVTAAVGSAAEAAALAASLMRQRLRPAEVIVSAGAVPETAAALAGLSDRGVAVRVVPSFTGTNGREASGGLGGVVPPGASREREVHLPRLASTGWVAPLEAGRDYPETYLADLACARECSQADAVGFGPADYEFTRWLEPALARRELLGTDAPPLSAWGSHGLRLFSVSADNDPAGHED
jgi:hypothetical protein